MGHLQNVWFEALEIVVPYYIVVVDTSRPTLANRGCRPVSARYRKTGGVAKKRSAWSSSASLLPLRAGSFWRQSCSASRMLRAFFTRYYCTVGSTVVPKISQHHPSIITKSNIRYVGTVRVPLQRAINLTILTRTPTTITHTATPQIK